MLPDANRAGLRPAHVRLGDKAFAGAWLASVMWNETIPDRLRGRLAGLEMISYTSGPTLGSFETGAVASLAGVRASVVSGGVICVLGTVALAAALPRFWRYDSRKVVTEEAPEREETVAGAP